MTIDLVKHQDKKAEILMLLYNRAVSPDMSVYFRKPEPMKLEEAKEIIATGQTYFDYLYGRVMKINLAANTLDTTLYNRDNGYMAAENMLKDFITKDTNEQVHLE